MIILNWYSFFCSGYRSYCNLVCLLYFQLLISWSRPLIFTTMIVCSSFLICSMNISFVLPNCIFYPIRRPYITRQYAILREYHSLDFCDKVWCVFYVGILILHHWLENTSQNRLVFSTYSSNMWKNWSTLWIRDILDVTSMNLIQDIDLFCFKFMFLRKQNNVHPMRKCLFSHER